MPADDPSDLRFGRLLVATLVIGDPNFDRSVILLLDHDDAGSVGVGASLTEVVKISPIPVRESGEKIEGDEPEQKATNLVVKLKEAKFI